MKKKMHRQSKKRDKLMQPKHPREPLPTDLASKGLALQKAGKLEEAEAIYKNALVFDPNNARLLNLLATVVGQKGNFGESINLLEKARSVEPNNAEIYYNLGFSLQSLKRYSDALENYDKSIAINPKNYAAYTNQGNILQLLRRYDVALTKYDKALELVSNDSKLYHNRGLAFYNLGKYQAALTNYEKATQINPNDTGALHNLGILKLLLGDFEQGWKLYELRWSTDQSGKIPEYNQPIWLGNESLVGKTILLHAEQGLGDTIQFCRYVPIIENLGATVILQVQKPLVGLISSLHSSAKIIVQDSELPKFDFHCPLISLPLALKTSLEKIPADVPYLFTKDENLLIWQNRLGQKSKPRIGLAWSGALGHKNDYNRSIPLEMIEPILQYDCEYHAIQKEIKNEDVEFLAQTKIVSHQEQLQNFTDTACLISEMDIIISVDTSVAHLAGALNKPVWILLPFVPDFRWLTEKDDSPWYPSAKLFRQQNLGDWVSVIEKISKELSGLFSCRNISHSKEINIALDLFAKATELHKNGKLKEAEIIYRNLLAFAPTDERVMKFLGIICAQQGKYQEGIFFMEKAISIKPENAEAYYNIGLIQQSLQKHEKAVDSYNKALIFAPDYVEAYNNRGIALYFLQRFADALSSYERALSIKPDYVDAQKNRDIILRNLK